MPPHGGLGIGLERMTMQLLGEGEREGSVAVPEGYEPSRSHKLGRRRAG